MSVDIFSFSLWNNALDFHALFFIHLGLSIVVAFISAKVLTEKYDANYKNTFWLFMFFNFLLVGIGYVLSIGLVVALHLFEFEDALHNVKTFDVGVQEGEFPLVARTCGEGGMQNYINNEYLPHHLRMQALTSVSKQKNRESLAFIKQAILSPDDEIRLFSFSVLDKFEKDLNSQIYINLELFNDMTQSSKEKASTAKVLAFLYWDMIYFDLSEGPLKKFSIDQSYFYAQKSLSLTPDTEGDSNHQNTLLTLLGKICFDRGEFEQAMDHFNKALIKSQNSDFIVPYLAEIHYRNGNYEEVLRLFENAKGLLINERMYPLAKQWTKE